MGEITERFKYSQARVDALNAELNNRGVGEFTHTAICMTGSYGRGEASARSDLDALLLSSDEDPDPDNPDHQNVHTRILKPRISQLDEIRLKSKLIEATRAVGLSDFDSDGRYLVNYTPSALTGMIGRVADDHTNTFTSRMLLLLEGRAVTNRHILDDARQTIIRSYWRDYRADSTSFAPAFMSNDILRMWRTFCVNYEARTASIPIGQRNKRRLKNYKLKYCRLLTCYSAILSMLNVYKRKETVTPDDMAAISSQSPCERILDLHDAADQNTRAALRKVVDGYEAFLQRMDSSEEALLELFADPSELKKMLEPSYEFANSIFECINIIGAGSKLHRMIVV